VAEEAGVLGAVLNGRMERVEATVSVANIGDQDFYVSRTYGIFHIPACAKGESCSLLLITPRGDALDLGDNRRFPFTISAREIAQDIVQDLDVHGIFVCDGARPTAEELQAAREKRDGWYHNLVSEADTMWARGHSYREISDMHRRAALSLGTAREWAYVAQAMVECPACGERVKASAAVCKHCGAVLDAEKAAKHGISGKAAVRPKAS
jgi:zinc-ribbon domain